VDKNTLLWVEAVNEEYGVPARVLDVGSYDYNGNARHLFPGSEYIGIDIKAGPGVDIVCNAERMTDIFEEASFDAVLCLHVLEHVPNVPAVLEQARQLLAEAGYLYVAVPTLGFPRHDYPADYWRMTEQAVREVVMRNLDILSFQHARTKYGKHPIIHCLGRK
jgi:SAM-dependent methyltransferase